MANGRAKQVMGIILGLMLATIWVQLLSTPVYAAHRQLASTPKALRGYWYTYGTKTTHRHASDLVYLHVTVNHIDGSVISRKTMKLGLQTFSGLNLNPGNPIATKLRANKTNTLYQINRNHWQLHALLSTADGKLYATGRYALKGQKTLFFQGLGSTKGFNDHPLAVHERLHGKHPVIKYTKISRQYLQSIGIFD